MHYFLSMMIKYIYALFPIYDNKKKGNAKEYRYEISRFKNMCFRLDIYVTRMYVVIYSISQKYSYDLHNERELARQSCFSAPFFARLFWSFDFYLFASHIYGVKRSTSPLSANKSTIESSRSVCVQWKEGNVARGEDDEVGNVGL